jgi:hypothetical protein
VFVERVYDGSRCREQKPHLLLEVKMHAIPECDYQCAGDGGKKNFQQWVGHNIFDVY